MKPQLPGDITTIELGTMRMAKALAAIIDAHVENLHQAGVEHAVIGSIITGGVASMMAWAANDFCERNIEHAIHWIGQLSAAAKGALPMWNDDSFQNRAFLFEQKADGTMKIVMDYDD